MFKDENGLDEGVYLVTGSTQGIGEAMGMTGRGTLQGTPVELCDRRFAVKARAPFLLMRDIWNRGHGCRRSRSA